MPFVKNSLNILNIIFYWIELDETVNNTLIKMFSLYLRYYNDKEAKKINKKGSEAGSLPGK